MFSKIKKYSIILTIAILFALFSVSIVDLISPKPDYYGLCGNYAKPAYPMSIMDSSACKGPVEPGQAEIDNCTNHNEDILNIHIIVRGALSASAAISAVP